MRCAWLLVAAVGVGALGCTQRLGDLSAMSNRNVNAPMTKTKRAKGEDCASVVLLIPMGAPNLEEATDRAMASDPNADVLVDVVVRSSAWNLLLYGQNCIEVEGTLARTGAAPAAGPAAPPAASGAGN